MRCIRFLRYHVGLVIHVEDVEGCAHGFFAEDVALYRFRKTRAGSVPAGVFGGRRPHGVLVTDRYTGYDRPWRVDRQYCYAHILRKFLRLLKKEPDNRGLVIARKTSFGGQSEGALRVREVNQVHHGDTGAALRGPDREACAGPRHLRLNGKEISRARLPLPKSQAVGLCAASGAAVAEPLCQPSEFLHPAVQ